MSGVGIQERFATPYDQAYARVDESRPRDLWLDRGVFYHRQLVQPKYSP